MARVLHRADLVVVGADGLGHPGHHLARVHGQLIVAQRRFELALDEVLATLDLVDHGGVVAAAHDRILQVDELVVRLAKQGLVVLRLAAEGPPLLLQLAGALHAPLCALGEQGLQLALAGVLCRLAIAVGAVQGGFDQAVQDLDRMFALGVHLGSPG